MRQSIKLAAATAFVISVPAFAQVPVVDGVLDASYGAALSIQQVQTQFGDANPNNGSELNAAYAKIDGGRLYVILTGNLERNFNKLGLYIDSKAGGENVMSATPEYDFLTGDGWNSTFQRGMTFDTGFEADYHLFARSGGGTGAGFEVDFVNRQGGTSAQVPGAAGVGAPFIASTSGFASTGTIAAGALGPNASASSLTAALDFALDNSNILGVTGGTGPADPAAALAVTTGFEFSIDLADIGYTGGGLRIAAMVNNSDHRYLSNQVLGGLPAGTGNLGGDGTGGFTGTLSGVNFNNFAGDQFFTVVAATPSFILGDFNFDGGVDASDIDPFVVAANEGDPFAGYIASSQAAFALLYPGQTLTAEIVAQIGDFNGDGGVDASDIDPFVVFANNGGSGIAAIPEPAALGFLAPMGLLLTRRRRGR